MRVCRFSTLASVVRIGLVTDDDEIIDLTPAGVTAVSRVLEGEDPASELRVAAHEAEDHPRLALSDVRLHAPIERQEVWAAGVTYLRSKTARMEESDFSATAYDRVYEAERPEIFFKALPEKVVPTGEPVGIRRDSKWNVPEPELAFVMTSRGAIAGYTIGNDMSSRDIEGQNLLYLPQAKTYHRSCALGPWITLGAPEEAARAWSIQLTIHRDGNEVFTGTTSVGQLKRSFTELAEFLFRSQEFPHGVVLLTGTGVVPDDSFTLQEGDEIAIDISGIGQLRNTVTVV
jgi:2-dehydro-3-deoxy-D-arabinonate dehydratase